MIEALDGYAVSHQVREDGQFVLLRARRLADGLPVLLLGARDGRRDSRARIEHEFALRADLDPAFAAMPLALACGPCGQVLVLADDGAAPLSLLAPTPLAPRAFLERAISITAALAQLHARDIVHKDLRPEHILVEPSTGRILLTGFGSAARLHAVPRGPDGYQSGSLPYMAPEQTGRVNRAVDTRSDLYALGVVLYQLLCGCLPFDAAEPLQWIYCHVARPPRPCADAIDRCCAAVVMKLLEKAPEQRYQNAAGLHADLAHCLTLLDNATPAVPFPLGRGDGVARVQAGAMLLGREGQLAVLQGALREAAAGAAVAPHLLAGGAGSGKSSLLAVLAERVRLKGAKAITVSFAADLAATPYAALRTAFTVQPGWRALLGADAALLAHVLPALGKPGQCALAEADARDRLHDAFRRLVGSLAAPGQPLLLCLDDLHWADTASLDLLSALVAVPAPAHVLVLGTMRGRANTGALATLHARFARLGIAVQRMVLPNLDRASCGELVARALDCPVPRCAPLAELVYARTAGNPLFILQLLTRLAECKLLTYAAGQGGWSWDAGAIAGFKGAASLADLLARRLQQLPYATLGLVRQLACLGTRASVSRLARVAGMSEAEVDEALWPAARLGLLLRNPGQYSFLHERVAEVAIGLGGRRSLPRRHLHIGQVLARGARGDAVFAAAAQMNRGREAMTAGQWRSLQRVNLAAARRARAALAFEAARGYYAAAAEAGGSAAWDKDYVASAALQLALADCERLCGDPEAARARLAALDIACLQRLGRPIVPDGDAAGEQPRGSWHIKPIPMMHINS